MGYVLRTNNISKIYGKRIVLDNVSIEIEQGDICGFIGPNGAGKSTLIKIIVGVATPNNGGIELFEESDMKSILEARGKIGSIIESPAFYHGFDAFTNMKIMCLFLGIKPERGFIEEKLSSVNLGEVGKKKVGNFSLGMKQRLAIAMALLKNPEFLILDEPANGLDPAGILEIRETILKLNKEKGITFLISSHILGELAKVATKYIIIRQGKIVEQIAAKDLEKKSSHVLKITVDDIARAVKIARELGGTDILVENNTITSKQLADSVKELTKRLVEEGVGINGVTTSSEDIESYLINTMGGR